MIKIREDDWQQFSSILKKEMSQESKAELVEICNRYLMKRTFENKAKLLSEKIKLAGKYQKKAKTFLDLAHSLSHPENDLDAYLAAEIEHHLKSARIAAHPDLLSEIAFQLEYSTRVVRDQIENERDSLYPITRAGIAFENWVLEVRKWAKTHGYSYGGNRNDYSAPTPFCVFLFNLNKRFPERLRPPVASPGAMGERLNRALQRGNNS